MVGVVAVVVRSVVIVTGLCIIGRFVMVKWVTGLQSWLMIRMAASPSFGVRVRLWLELSSAAIIASIVSTVIPARPWLLW